MTYLTSTFAQRNRPALVHSADTHSNRMATGAQKAGSAESDP
jgi:hypothetical protein